jgi:Flp pilus assembly protein CpaB
MRKTTLIAAAAAAVMLVCVGGWVASTPNATAAATPAEQIDIMQMTVNAKDLPTQYFRDMTFVF